VNHEAGGIGISIPCPRHGSVCQPLIIPARRYSSNNFKHSKTFLPLLVSE